MTTLFTRDFEDGLLYRRNTIDGVVNSGGTIEISAGAALVGNYGLSVTPRATTYSNYNNIALIYEYSLIPLTRFRQRFYFDPNTISCSDSKIVRLSRQTVFSPIYDISLYHTTGGAFYIYASIYTDTGGLTAIDSSVFAITDNSHYIEMDWKASSSPGADDGFLNLWIDGTHKGTTDPTIQAVDNDTLRVSRMSLGCCAGHAATVSGTLYFDNWTANDDGTAIGA